MDTAARWTPSRALEHCLSCRLVACDYAGVISGPMDQPTQPPSGAVTSDVIDPHDSAVKRRAAYFYGLIVCGAVLAADPENVRLWVIGVALVSTVLVYWFAETYVHWVAARSTRRRNLTTAERWATISNGFPLVLACAVPAGVLLIEGVAGVSTPTAVQVALVVNVILLVGVG